MTILSLPDRDHVSGLCRANPAKTQPRTLRLVCPMCPAHHPNPWEWERRQVDVGKCLTPQTGLVYYQPNDDKPIFHYPGGPTRRKVDGCHGRHGSATAELLLHGVNLQLKVTVIFTPVLFVRCRSLCYVIFIINTNHKKRKPKRKVFASCSWQKSLFYLLFLRFAVDSG